MTHRRAIKTPTTEYILTYNAKFDKIGNRECYTLTATLTENGAVIESEEAPDVTSDKAATRRLAKYLCENEVFPSQLMYILDDMLGTII